MRLGELLVRENMISARDLQAAIEAQRTKGGRLAYHLTKLKKIDEKALTHFLAKQYRIPAIDLRKIEITPEIIKLVPRDVAERHAIVPISRSGQTLILAMADPSNIFAIDDVKFITNYNIEAVVAGEEAIMEAIEKYYSESKEAMPDEKPTEEKPEETEQKKGEEMTVKTSYGFITPKALTVIAPGENGAKPKQETIVLKILKNGALSKKSTDALMKVIEGGNFIIVPFRL